MSYPRPQMGIPTPSGPGPGMPPGQPPAPPGPTGPSTQGYDLRFDQGMPVAVRRTLGRNGRPAVPQRSSGPALGGRVGLGGSLPGSSRFQQTGIGAGRLRDPHNSPYMSQPAALQRLDTGVRPGNNMMGGPSVPSPTGGPSLDQIQSEMARRQVGAQLGPRNGALAGYMMG